MSDQSTPEPRGLAAINGWWAAAGFFILLVVFAVVAVLVLGGHTQATAPGSSTTTAAPSSGSAAAAPSADQQPLTTAPSSSWALFHGIAIPVSSTAGPSRRKGPLWSGYSHTATGALLAANYLVFSSDGPEAASVLKTQGVDGPVARAIIAATTATPPVMVPGGAPSIGGFRFVSYTPTTARVELLLIAANYAGEAPVDLTWQDGDWKINLEPGGTVPQPVKIDGSAGFILWSAR